MSMPWIEPSPIEFMPSPSFVQVISGMRDENGNPIVPIAVYLPQSRFAFVMNKDTALQVAHNIEYAASGLYIPGTNGSQA